MGGERVLGLSIRTVLASKAGNCSAIWSRSVQGGGTARVGDVRGGGRFCGRAAWRSSPAGSGGQRGSPCGGRARVNDERGVGHLGRLFELLGCLASDSAGWCASATGKREDRCGSSRLTAKPAACTPNRGGSGLGGGRERESAEAGWAAAPSKVRKFAKCPGKIPLLRLGPSMPRIAHWRNSGIPSQRSRGEPRRSRCRMLGRLWGTTETLCVASPLINNHSPTLQQRAETLPGNANRTHPVPKMRHRPGRVK